MKKIIIPALLSLFFITASAQQHSKPVFSSYNAGGLQIGQEGYSASLESTNGLRFNKWFAGLGIAFDGYRYKSLPGYLDLKYFPGRKEHFFLLADAGYSVMPFKNEGFFKLYPNNKVSGGLFAKTGAAYLLQPGKKKGFYFQLDYELKTIHESYDYMIIADFPSFGNDYVDTYKTRWNLRTLNVKIGFRF